MLNENQRLIAQHMSEKDLTDSIIELAQRLGYLVDGSYFRDRLVGIAAKEGRFDAFPDKGFPDLVMVRDKPFYPVLFVEVKTEKGKLSEGQKMWQKSLVGLGKQHYVWRPRHWHSGEIEHVLRGER